MYSFFSRIRYSECDAEGRLSLIGLLNYFQDCSTQQSEDLGIGVEVLHRRGALWVVNSWQIDILRWPALGEKVEAVTIPYDIKGFFGKRNFCMKDENGEYLAKADSFWTYISDKTGSPLRIPPDILNGYVMEEKLDMDYQGRKIDYPKDGAGAVKGKAVPVTEYLLDANHHVNNGKYVEIATGFVREADNIDRLRVEYRKQAFLGETMYPETYDLGSRQVVKLSDSNDIPYTIVEFTKL